MKMSTMSIVESYKTDWFFRKYKDKLIVDPFDPFTAGRYVTMQIAINLFRQGLGRVIVETGCQRELDDWGAGCSTTVFADLVSQSPHLEHGARFFSIDNNPKHIAVAKEAIGDNHSFTTFIEGDSVTELARIADYSYSLIDLLYLDSFDYPLFVLLDRYGSRTDPEKRDNPIYKIPDETLARDNEDLVRPCQEHCLQEFEAALPWLAPHTTILIDDANFPGGGKARLARPRLAEAGFKLVLDAHQAVWTR